MQQIRTDHTLNVKKSKFVKNGLKSKFEADLVIMIDEKYKRLNITHEIIRLCCEEIQKRDEYREDAAIQNLKNKFKMNL